MKRWQRIRRWSRGSYRDFGPLRIGAELNMEKAPLPRLSVTREEGEVGLVLSFGDAGGDRFAEAHATVTLPLWLRWLAPARVMVARPVRFSEPEPFETEIVPGGVRG